jgi:heme/copper-type cytochrome/quinol oxidase subunit 2
MGPGCRMWERVMVLRCPGDNATKITKNKNGIKNITVYNNNANIVITMIIIIIIVIIVIISLIINHESSTINHHHSS